MTLPRRVKLIHLLKDLPAIDIFICSASYEDRSLSIPLSLDPAEVQAALICGNEDHLDRLGHNLSKLKAHFGHRSNLVMLRTDRPLDGADRLLEAIQRCKLGKSKTILVDITTFTHEGLLVLLKLLSILWVAGDHIILSYAPASDYAVGMSSEDKWLSRGIRDIRSVLGYPGLLRPSQKLHLVVLVGFEADRARLLIDTCEPDAISLGKGVDATDAGKAHLPRNVDALRELAVHYPRFNEFSFSTMDVQSTKDAIRSQVELYPHHNTVIAPMNTKLSTVGAALYSLDSPNSQLCYAPAVTYNLWKYSLPGDDCLILDLDLEAIRH